MALYLRGGIALNLRCLLSKGNPGSLFMKFFKLLPIGILSSVFLNACSTAPEEAAVADRSGRGSRPANPVRQVMTRTATEKPVEQLVVVTGTLAAEQEIVLGMKIAGRLAEVQVDLG